MKSKISFLIFMLVASVIFVGCNQQDLEISDVNEGNKDVVDSRYIVEENNGEQNIEVEDNNIEDDSTEKESNEEYQESEEVLSEEKYLETVQESIDIFKDLIDILNQTVDEAVANPSLLNDEDWIDGYKFMFKPITALGEVFIQLEEEGKVPKDMYDLHVKVKESVVSMSQAGDKLTTAIENDMDTKVYDEGMELMRDSADKMNDVIDIVNEMQENK